jgi:hypothetical protein
MAIAMSPRLIGSKARRLLNFAGVALEQFGEVTGRVSQFALDLAGLLHTRENADRLRDEPSADSRTAEAPRRRATSTGNGRAEAPVRPASSRPAAPDESAPAEPRRAESPPAESPPAESPPAESSPTAQAAPPEPPAAAPDSAHVEPEEELVAESADPGAVDGAGAAITVDPPWPGYDSMRAQDVISHAETVDAAQLAVAELYERAHKSRTTVLDAFERQLARTRQAG